MTGNHLKNIKGCQCLFLLGCLQRIYQKIANDRKCDNDDRKIADDRKCNNSDWKIANDKGLKNSIFAKKESYFGQSVLENGPPSSRMGTYRKTEGIQSYLRTWGRFDPIELGPSQAK